VLVGEALIAFPAARLMDWLGRRMGLSMGHLFGLVGAAITGWSILVGSIPGFLIGMVVLGFARGALDLGRYAAADASPPDQRARAISLVVLGGTVGSIFGPSLVTFAGLMAIQLGVPEPLGIWLLMGVFFVAAALILTIFLRPDPREIARQIAVEHSTQPVDTFIARKMWALLADPRIQLAIGGLVFSQLSMITVMVITPVFMVDHHGKGAVSLVLMAHTLGMFGFSFLTGWLTDRFGRPAIILVGGLISTLACLLAPFLDTVPWLGLTLFLLGLGWNLSFVASSSLLDESLNPAEKGRGRGLADTLVKVSSGVGSLGSGLLFAATSYALTSWLTIVIALVPALLAVWFSLRRPPTLQEPAAAD
jgi:MFS family permease